MKHNITTFMALLVYIDDVLLISNYVDDMNYFKLALHSKFSLENLGTL